MRQTADPLTSGFTAQTASGFGALVRRLAVAGVLVAAFTILASIALVL
jgi:hypothetical protein